MKVFLIAATFFLAATAAPQDLEVAAREREAPPLEIIKILKDERVQPEEGIYSFQVETANGIRFQEDGTPGSAGQTNVQGFYSFPMNDGSFAEVTYIADENGFQVQSPLLPVAPEFPHPIPQYVLDQIAFAEEQKRLQAQQEE